MTMRLTLFVLVLVVLGWSGYAPHDRFTWFLEVAPVLIGLPIVLLTARRFPLTPLVCTLLAIHACILMVGGKYTYAGNTFPAPTNSGLNVAGKSSIS